jgi:hypothetical protein
MSTSTEPTAATPALATPVAPTAARADALADYAAATASQRTPVSVLGPLLHLHHLRVIGAGTEAERVSGRLARALALRPRHLRGEVIR